MDITALSSVGKPAVPAPVAGPGRDVSAPSAPAPGARVAGDVDAGAAIALPAVDETKHEDPATLKKTVDELNAVMKHHSNSIEFSIDEESGKTIVKVMDTESNTVLKQYPSRELLAIAKQIDQFQGMFVKTQA